jgi:hypothetical protein
MASDGSGVSEIYAKTLEGMSPKEAMFFGTCIEASYKMVKFIDDQALKGRSGELLKQDIIDYMRTDKALESFQTGILPVPGTEIMPVGPYIIPFKADAVLSLSARDLAKDVSDPIAFRNKLLDAYLAN